MRVNSLNKWPVVGSDLEAGLALIRVHRFSLLNCAFEKCKKAWYSYWNATVPEKQEHGVKPNLKNVNLISTWSHFQSHSIKSKPMFNIQWYASVVLWCLSGLKHHLRLSFNVIDWTKSPEVLAAPNDLSLLGTWINKLYDPLILNKVCTLVLNSKDF